MTGLKQRRYWYALLALSLLLAVAGWFRTDSLRSLREMVYPFENANAWMQRHVGTPLSVAFTRIRTSSRNHDLESEMERLKVELSRMEAVATENRRLRAALEFAPPPDVRALPCPVLSHGGTTGWQRLVRLGKGVRDGVHVGDPVVVAEGLIGRVERVALHTSDVLLISDPNCRIACELDPPPPGLDAVRGVLYGGGGHASDENTLSLLYVLDPLRLRFLKRDIELAPRTRVVTSGLGGVFPRGLTVGYVLDSTTDPNSLYRDAEIMPAADMDDLTVVFVLARREERAP